MNYRMLGYLLGIILLIEAALMALPVCVGIVGAVILTRRKNR